MWLPQATREQMPLLQNIPKVRYHLSRNIMSVSIRHEAAFFSFNLSNIKLFQIKLVFDIITSSFRYFYKY